MIFKQGLISINSVALYQVGIESSGRRILKQNGVHGSFQICDLVD